MNDSVQMTTLVGLIPPFFLQVTLDLSVTDWHGCLSYLHSLTQDMRWKIKGEPQAVAVLFI